MQNSQKIFAGPIKTHLLVFAEEGSKGYDELTAGAKEVAKANKGKLLTVTVGKGNDRVNQYFGVTKGACAAVADAWLCVSCVWRAVAIVGHLL